MPTFRGFVQVRADRELYIEYVRPQAGKPTVILLNGLTYSLRQFESYASALTRRGIGVLRFDFNGMGATLLKYAPSLAPYPYDQQVADLKNLLKATGIRPPYNLAGLSYGGGIAVAYALTFPREIKNLILIAPYTQPLSSQDKMIQQQIWMTRRLFPSNPATDDELYDFFLRQTVYSSYPTAEPIVLENPYKLEAIYNLVRGIRKFRPVDFANRLPPGTVHVMQPMLDQYIPADLYETFWKRLLPGTRMSRLRVYQVEHKMTEFVPDFAAAWTWQILKGNPLLRQGRVFDAWPVSTGTVRSGNEVIRLDD
ncbi:MAG: alpha/beta hydrolase [Bdellovibrionaceae bacterium]|nr:alpha/beta hydrolase [Pseudobdellovibrionaceae bacterium]